MSRQEEGRDRNLRASVLFLSLCKLLRYLVLVPASHSPPQIPLPASTSAQREDMARHTEGTTDVREAG